MIKRYLSPLITIALELMKHWTRHTEHSRNVKKLDKTAEKLGTVENMLVRLEERIQTNREILEKLKVLCWFSVAVNVVILLVIFVKVMGCF